MLSGDSGAGDLAAWTRGEGGAGIPGLFERSAIPCPASEHLVTSLGGRGTCVHWGGEGWGCFGLGGVLAAPAAVCLASKPDIIPLHGEEHSVLTELASGLCSARHFRCWLKREAVLSSQLINFLL